MMDGIKQEYQKFYDLLASSGPGGQGPAMELIMRTLDQEGMQATQNCDINNTTNNTTHQLIQHTSNIITSSSSSSSINTNNISSSSSASNNNNNNNNNSSMHAESNAAHSIMSNATANNSVSHIDGSSPPNNSNQQQTIDQHQHHHQVETIQQLSSKLELHPNLVLQSLGISPCGGEEQDENNSLQNNTSSGSINGEMNLNLSGNTSGGGGDNGGNDIILDNSGGNGGTNGGGGSGVDRPHICQICNASYKTRTHLRRHMFVHLNNRPYPCSDCGKGFNRKEHLTKHIEAVHSGTKHKCQYCGKEISRKDHLSRHIKNMHPTLAGITKDTDQSVLKLQLPCNSHKQQARLSFLTPNYPTPSGNGLSLSTGALVVSPVKENRGNKILMSATVGINNSTTNNEIVESQSQERQEQREDANSAAAVTENNMNILDQAFQHFTQVSIIPGGSIVVPGGLPGQIAATVTVGNPIVPSSSAAGDINVNNTLRNSSQQNLISESSLIENKLSSRNNNGSNSIPASFSISNGLVGLTNLSMSLGGQMRELPFGDCESGGMIGLSNKKKSTKILACTECESTFTSEKEYSAHLRSHKPQNFRCTECPRAYTRREKLTEHIRCFHQGQKFKCEYCGKELSRKDHVLRHVRSIHPEVLASRFTAHLQETSIDCGGGDGMSGSLLLSSSSGGNNNGNISSSSSSAMNEMGVLLRSVCHVCLKVFGTSYHLSRHIDSCHKGDVRPYSCNSCSKQFKRKDHLTKHMKSHCPSTRDGNNRSSSNNSADGNSVAASSTRSSSNTKVPNKNKSSRDDKSGGKSEKGKSNAVQSTKKDLQSTKTDHNNSSSSRLKETEAEFNLAMINSFIAENVNVVVEETDLSNLMNPDDDDQLGGQGGNSGSNSSVGSERESRENVLNLDEVEEGGGGGRRGDESSVSLTAISSQNNNNNNNTTNSFRHPLIQHDVNSASTLNKIAY